MRRTLAAVALTVIGLWLVLSFKSSPVSRVSHLATPATTAPATMAPPTTAPATPGDTGQEPGAGPPPGSGSSTAQPAPSAPRTINGDVVPTRYGDVQVAVVLNGSQIVDVKALQLPFDRARSQAISDQVAPMLHDEVVQAQGAQIDTIGGATYTSDGYAQSLQSALDNAHG